MAKGLLLNLFIGLIAISAAKAVTCTYEQDSCLCKHDDEVILDLKKLVPKPIQTTLADKSLYIFSGCSDDVSCGNEKTSLCMKTELNATLSKYTNLGNAKAMEVVPSDTHLSEYDIRFTNLDSIISLICSPELVEPHLVTAKGIYSKSNNISVQKCNHDNARPRGLKVTETL